MATILATRKLSASQLKALAQKYGYDVTSIQTVINVETPGFGFSPVTGKPLIQFEPVWFKRSYAEWAKHKGTWFFNGINDQTEEWLAFNNAFAISPGAAMQATSIGIMQVMGFHYADLGFKSVGEMWDYAKVSEANQVELGLRFIKSNPLLSKALKNKDWATFAYYYNGADYKKLAIRYNTKPYDFRLRDENIRLVSLSIAA